METTADICYWIGYRYIPGWVDFSTYLEEGASMAVDRTGAEPAVGGLSEYDDLVDPVADDIERWLVFRQGCAV